MALVAFAALLYVMAIENMNFYRGETGSTATAIGVTVSQSSNGADWVLTFADVPPGKANATVSLSISDSGGAVLFASTPLDALAGVSETYSPMRSEGALSADDRILLSVASYPAGSTYQLHDANRVLAQGTLQ